MNKSKLNLELYKKLYLIRRTEEKIGVVGKKARIFEIQERSFNNWGNFFKTGKLGL